MLNLQVRPEGIRYRVNQQRRGDHFPRINVAGVFAAIKTSNYRYDIWRGSICPANVQEPGWRLPEEPGPNLVQVL